MKKTYDIYYTETTYRVSTVVAESAQEAREIWEEMDADDGKWVMSEFEVTSIKKAAA